MTDQSLAQTPARTPATPTPLDELAGRIEEELERLRAKRPHLSRRIDRAGGILVMHLACPRQRLIRVRVGEGRPRVLVQGSKGSVYVVDPSDWSCSCPDHHRRGAVCKHGIATYLLVRAARPQQARKLLPCTSCRRVLPQAELVEVTEDDALLSWHEGDRLCRECIRSGAWA